MRNAYFPVCLLGVLLALQGCNTMGKQPEFVQTGIAPDMLHTGDLALITVELKDKYQIVTRIEAVVQEDPRITFVLNDKGESSDEAAGDGIWSFGVKVPFQAPTGTFNLDLTAYREDGEPVSVRDADGNVVPLKKTVPMKILPHDGATAVEMDADSAAPTPVEVPDADPAPVAE
ncbi:MAG: hypothetical protein GC168_17130 [Candidatus Hydrogenedens sp.]|nr:hypothetical protein [Candidatus Hydrogenedens sp.]